MLERQVIWIESEATTFAGFCDACLADPVDPEDGLSYRAAKVAGSVRRDADVRFARCRRGHRLCIRRAARGERAPAALRPVVRVPIRPG